MHGLLAPTSEAVHFPRTLVERIPRSVVTGGLGNDMRGDDREAPESPEDVIHYENRCACVDFYHMTGGCGCLRPAVEGSIYCSECRSEGCDCRCPQCRTSACTGVEYGCECVCCRSDRRGYFIRGSSSGKDSKAPTTKERLPSLEVIEKGIRYRQKQRQKEEEEPETWRPPTVAVSSNSFLPDSVLTFRSDRCGPVLQEEEKTTVYIIHARDQDSRAASVLVAPLAVEPVDRLMCLREITYDQKNQKQGESEIPFCCSSETVGSRIPAPRCRVPRSGTWGKQSSNRRHVRAHG